MHVKELTTQSRSHSHRYPCPAELENEDLWVLELMKMTVYLQYKLFTLGSWYTNLEQRPLNRCQQLPPPYKRLIHDQNETDNGLLTDRLNSTDQKTDNLTNYRRSETHQWLMTNFTQFFQPIPSWLNWPMMFNRPTL